MADNAGHTARGAAAQALVDLLQSFLTEQYLPTSTLSDGITCQQTRTIKILTAIEALVATLTPGPSLFASFHDGKVHYPLGAGAYAFEKDLIGPLLSALVRDENIASLQKSRNGLVPDGVAQAIVTRPVVVHAGAQPNNSPHAGTLVVFCLAFLLAQQLRDQAPAEASGVAEVSVEVSLVDTAPVNGLGMVVDGVHYQRSYRDVAGALETHLDEYKEVLRQMSTWSGIPFKISFQSEFFSQPHMSSLLAYMIESRAHLASQLSPKHHSLALRSACPHPDCALTEKHGRLNQYKEDRIIFRCPRHGDHDICLSNPQEVARLEANAPARNLLRSMLHLLDESTHHIRVTGADYAGTYQESFLYRPLAEWSASTGLAAGRTPHILYAPLVVDWSGAKLSKGLYIRQGGYESMKTLGTDELCSYARLIAKHGPEGLKHLWSEVERWLADPHKLFRASVSVEYLRGLLAGREWQ